jgi:hypothetical protein
MSNVNTGISIHEDILQGLDDWADEEFRSRNSLIQQILAQAVRHRMAVRKVAAKLGTERAGECEQARDG